MTTRESFVEHFGEEQAWRVEQAALEHRNGVHDNPGSDPFRWAIAITIGYECFTRSEFREYHRITVPVEEIKAWICKHGDLRNHDGDVDYMSMFCGRYDEYVKEANNAD